MCFLRANRVLIFACVIVPVFGPLTFAADDLAVEKTATRFTELDPASTGVNFVHPIDVSHPKKYLYVAGYASAGIAIGDLNGDGLQDIFLAGGPVASRLYLQVAGDDNKPSLRFRDATTTAKLDGGTAWSAGTAMVDIDNDGDLDLYVCNYDSPNFLYLNETQSPDEPRFVESAQAFGLNIVDASFMPAFCDYDLDGDLDVLITGHQYIDPRGNPKTPPVAQKDGEYYVLDTDKKYYGLIPGKGGKQVFTNVGRRDYLLRNNLSQVGDRKKIRFSNATEAAGITGIGVGNSVVWWDFNQDGWPDIHIGNDFKVADQLFLNNKNGTFTDVITQSFAHTTWFSMGSDVGDVNNDGMLDLLVSDMAGTTHYRSKVTMGEMSSNEEFLKTAIPRQMMRNALLINTGTPRFMEAAYMAGLASSDWTWATKLADFDNDGWLDVYFTNGAARMFNHSDITFTAADRIGKTQWDVWENTDVRREENLAFRNLGDLRFQNVSEPWGLKKLGMSYAAATGDLDDDGDLDIVVVNLEEPVSIYRNDTPDSNYLRVKLVGRANNRFGLGATVAVHSGDRKQVRQVNPMTGFMSCNEPFAHFGIGDMPVDKVTVTWLGGNHQVIDRPDINQTLTITEPSKHSVGPRVAQDRRLFRRSRTFPNLKHAEKEFDDFARQPLLPNKHSQLGPGIALSDVDSDGDLDIYLGRAKGSPRAVYENQGKASLGVKSVTAFKTHANREDMGVLFFDVDRDGDQDLYAVSGSVECSPGDVSLGDRLYVNDGMGVFSLAAGTAMPPMTDSGSVVCAADYDRDGDLDLFVGSRIVPGEYPETPTSHMLENKSAPNRPKLVEATEKVAPALRTVGLVTGAIWSDADGDGWVDLLVTLDWGPVKFYRNEADSSNQKERRLVERTNESQLAKHVGWWNGIASRDIDNDGDLDYVVTNFGLNTKYHPTPQKPELLFYGDFDNTGKPHLVEAKYEQGKCFPRRGLSCSSHAMPFVREKVGTFHNFGVSTLSDIYTDTKLDTSMQLTADTLDSGVLFNDGNSEQTGLPVFRFEPLPRLAQISPSFGVVLGDFDADGWTDCFLAQNFYGPQHETGRMDSGVSLVLRGVQADGQFQFEPAWPQESGILVPGDAKSAAIADFNEDNWPDLLVTVNNDVIEAFEGQPHATNKLLRVRLVGKAGNLDCAGAIVRVDFADSHSPDQLAEIHAGGGYLSQGEPVLSFGCGTGAPVQISVRWPNGTATVHPLDRGQLDVTIRQQ